MDPIAIVMMVVAILTVWGGLAVSLIHLNRNPDHLSGDEGIDPGPTT